jgi:hypothetical protein
MQGHPPARRRAGDLREPAAQAEARLKAVFLTQALSRFAGEGLNEKDFI